MSREIKFRFWEDNRFQHLSIKDMLNFLNNGDVIHMSSEAHNTIQQFTGKLDRDGKEIYEGDIVEVNSHMLATIQSNPISGFIEYRDGGFFINNGRLPEYHFPMHSFPSNSYYKIIGNINEDRELLNIQ